MELKIGKLSILRVIKLRIIELWMELIQLNFE